MADAGGQRLRRWLERAVFCRRASMRRMDGADRPEDSERPPLDLPGAALSMGISRRHTLCNGDHDCAACGPGRGDSSRAARRCRSPPTLRLNYAASTILRNAAEMVRSAASCAASLTFE